MADKCTDAGLLVALAELTGRHNDARSMLQIGKPALARGLALDHYAFPTIGIPEHKQIGLEIERSVIYSVARTESAFDQRDKSPANAVGLMQVTPEAGRDTAKRFGVSYDWDRMVSDPVYNTQMGAAEISALLKEYSGSHIMTFAGYNAGRGRVRDWVKLHGDPRDRMWMQSIGWTPFLSRRRAIMCSASSRTFWSIASGSSAPRRCRKPINAADTRRRPTRFRLRQRPHRPLAEVPFGECRYAAEFGADRSRRP